MMVSSEQIQTYFGEERLNMFNMTDLGSDMFNLYAEYITRNAGLDEA